MHPGKNQNQNLNEETDKLSSSPSSNETPTPEGDDEDGVSPNVECFQNFTAPEVFIQGLAGMVNQQDAETIIKSQKYMLQRFEKTNEMLINCNQLSAARFQNAARDFKKHTAMLQEMKKDIDNIFKRIRNIKAKVAQHYPEAYEIAATAQRREKCREEEEEEEDEDEEDQDQKPSSTSTTISTPPTSSSTAVNVSKSTKKEDEKTSLPKPSKSSEV